MKKIKLLPSRDYTFCKYEDCNKSDKCSRNLKHYDWDLDDPRFARLSILLNPDHEECNIFLDGMKL